MGTWIAVATALSFAVFLLGLSYGRKRRSHRQAARHRATMAARLDFATMGTGLCTDWPVKRSDFRHRVNRRLAALQS